MGTPEPRAVRIARALAVGTAVVATSSITLAQDAGISNPPECPPRAPRDSTDCGTAVGASCRYEPTYRHFPGDLLVMACTSTSGHPAQWVTQHVPQMYIRPVGGPQPPPDLPA